MKRPGIASTGSRLRKGIFGFGTLAVTRKRKDTALIVAAIVAASAFRTALPWPVKWIFDAATGATAPTAAVVGIAAALIVVISAVMLFLTWYATSGSAERIEETVSSARRSVLAYLQFLPAKELGYHAESASRFLTDLSAIRRAVTNSGAGFLQHSLTILATIVVMLAVDWKLGLLTAVMLPLYWLPTPGMIQRLEERFSSDRVPSTSARASVAFFANSATKMVLAAGVAILLWLGAGMVVGGAITIGQLSLFLGYLVLARTPMIDLQRAVVALDAARESREEVDKLLVALDISAPFEAKRMPPKFEGRVGFQNVFVSDGDASLDNVTLKVRPKRRVAFTGGDPASRVTMMRLILNLSQPDNGRVLIDGADVSEYDATALRSQIAAVPNDPIMMDSSIGEYVSAADPHADRNAVRAALEAVELLEWVDSLPRGINSRLVEHIGEFTLGRKRLLAMARAAYMDAPFLILDRPTTDLASEDERAIIVAIDKLSKGRTTLLITDDLRIAARFDQIILMDQGRVVEAGSHEDLVEGGGTYASLFHNTSPGPVLYSTKQVALTAVFEDRREPENINPFVFLVGCPGSGVRLIQQIIERHPMLAVANDTHFIPTVLKESGAQSDVPLTDDLVDRARTFPNFDRLGLDNVEVYKAGGMADTYAQFVTNLYNLFAERQGKELVGIKAPTYCRDIRLLHDLFPWARYIHVVRDGRDVAMSVLERATRLKEAIELTNVETVPIGASALWWKSNVETARRDGARLGNRFYLELRFEDLVQQPQNAMREITAFLDLPYKASMLDGEKGYASLELVANGFQDWRSQMSRNDVGLFEALAGDLLDGLNYGRGVPSIPEDILREAERCLASWRAQRPQPTGKHNRAASNA